MRILAAVDEQEFLDDFRNRDAAKYQLIVGIEVAIDICNHLAAALGGRSPSDYADCFSLLSELGIVPASLVERLRPMAQLRNLVVHLYWVVDSRRVHEMLRKDAEDLDRFRDEILAWMRSQGLAERGRIREPVRGEAGVAGATGGVARGRV